MAGTRPVSWFANLRWLAYGRRFIVSVESIAKSIKTMAKYAEEDWLERHTPKTGKMADIHYFDPQRASDEWEQKQRNQQG